MVDLCRHWSLTLSFHHPPPTASVLNIHTCLQTCIRTCIYTCVYDPWNPHWSLLIPLSPYRSLLISLHRVLHSIECFPIEQWSDWERDLSALLSLRTLLSSSRAWFEIVDFLWDVWGHLQAVGSKLLTFWRMSQAICKVWAWSCCFFEGCLRLFASFGLEVVDLLMDVCSHLQVCLMFSLHFRWLC